LSSRRFIRSAQPKSDWSRKRFSFAKLAKDNPVAFNGEPGYQADLLMPGLRWKTVLVFTVEKYRGFRYPRERSGSSLPQGADAFGAELDKVAEIGKSSRTPFCYTAILRRWQGLPTWANDDPDLSRGYLNPRILFDREHQGTVFQRRPGMKQVRLIAGFAV